jgi:MFS transporter
VTLVLALAVFAAGHVVVALASDFALLLAARFVTAWATGAFWAVASVVATRASGPAASSRALGLVGAGGMLANVVGVPLGALAGQLSGWRGPFWALAALALVAVALIARYVPHNGPDRSTQPVRAELAALRSGRLWLALAACATTTGGVLSAYSYVAPLLTDRAEIAAGLVPLVLVGFGVGSLVGSVLGGRLGDALPVAVDNRVRDVRACAIETCTTRHRRTGADAAAPAAAMAGCQAVGGGDHVEGLSVRPARGRLDAWAGWAWCWVAEASSGRPTTRVCWRPSSTISGSTPARRT